MSARRRRYFRTGLLAAMAVLVVASLAWACTPDADIDITPSTVPSGGTPVDVNGAKFVDGTTVEIRWNAVDGPLLATATARGTNGTFSARVVTPQAPADSYTIVVVGRDANENPVVERSQLVVGEPAGTAPAPAGRPAERPAELSGAERDGDSARVDARVAPRSGGQQPSSTADDTPAATAAAPTTDATGAPASPPPSPDRDAAPRTADRPSADAPPAGSATGDLWSGFESGKAPATAAPAVNAPLPGDDGSSPYLVVGVALLGIGLVALFGAAALAQTRRRRVPAGKP